MDFWKIICNPIPPTIPRILVPVEYSSIYNWSLILLMIVFPSCLLCGIYSLIKNVFFAKKTNKSLKMGIVLLVVGIIAGIVYWLMQDGWIFAEELPLPGYIID